MKMKPLEGYRILAISQYGAGPYASLHLADLGAEVIKIEDRATGGDISRSVIPYATGGDSLYFQSLNRNKKSITLNLKHPRGQELLHQLAARSNLLFNNLRGDVPERLGLTYTTLEAVNPKLVTCSLTGYGTRGKLAAEPAYDYLFQALLGHMSLTGEPEGPPEKYGVSMIDFATGLNAALAMTVGLLQAERDGVGCDLDVSLFDTAASLLNYLAIWALNRDYKPAKTRHSAHPSLVPSQLFATSDGYLVVMCNKEKFFPLLCEVLGRPELASDARFATFTDRLENKALLLPELEAAFRRKPSAHWSQVLTGKVPAAPVQSVEEGLRHPLLRERDMLVTVPHPQFGELKMIGLPMRISGFRPEYKPAPTLGQHNREIFTGLLGIGEDELAEMEAQGII